MDLTLAVPCLFGLEGIAADELRRLGMKNVAAENGRVLFSGDESDAARANINLRCGERVFILVGSTAAETFDALFEGVKAMPWENYIPMDGAFPVTGHTLDSKLHSIPDCQKIIKKAIVERLKSRYHISWFREEGAKYQIRFTIMKDVAVLNIDTSGVGLHKRGYRPVGNAAPLRETLAAAMVTLSRYRGRDYVCDPFCGSGTIPIEAALIALNRAPGLYRRFESMNWKQIGKDVWKKAVEEARDKEYRGNYEIWGGDIDPDCIDISRENAKRAGVGTFIKFEQADAGRFYRDKPGVIITNPPYGERVMEQAEAVRQYKRFGDALSKVDGWKYYILSSHDEFEREFGHKADKKRKLYNGMIKCDLYMFTKGMTK